MEFVFCIEGDNLKAYIMIACCRKSLQADKNSYTVAAQFKCIVIECFDQYKQARVGWPISIASLEIKRLPAIDVIYLC